MEIHCVFKGSCGSVIEGQHVLDTLLYVINGEHPVFLLWLVVLRSVKQSKFTCKHIPAVSAHRVQPFDVIN